MESNGWAFGLVSMVVLQLRHHEFSGMEQPFLVDVFQRKCHKFHFSCLQVLLVNNFLKKIIHRINVKEYDLFRF